MEMGLRRSSRIRRNSVLYSPPEEFEALPLKRKHRRRSSMKHLVVSTEQEHPQDPESNTGAGPQAGARGRGSGRTCRGRGSGNISIWVDFVDSTSPQIEPITAPITQPTSEQGSIEPLETPNFIGSTRLQARVTQPTVGQANIKPLETPNSHDSTRAPIAPTTQQTIEQASIEPTTSGVHSTTVARRGPNASIEALDTPKDREVIYIFGKIFQPNNVVRQIVSSIKDYMGPHPTWKSVPLKTKVELWDEFNHTYQFINETEHKKAKKIWNNVCAIRYKDLMKKARDESMKLAKCTSYNFEKMVMHPPSFIKTEHWVLLCKQWSEETWCKKSNSSSQNRKKGSTLNHVGGSIPFITHAENLKKEKNGIKPTHVEVFDRTHKKDGVYVNDKARDVREKYKKAIIEKYGNDETSQLIFDVDIWKEAAGGVKKGQLFGLGSKEDIKTLLGDSSTSSVASRSVHSLPPPNSSDMQSLILAMMETPNFKALLDKRQKQTEECIRQELRQEMKALREMLVASSKPLNRNDVDGENRDGDDELDGDGDGEFDDES